MKLLVSFYVGPSNFVTLWHPTIPLVALDIDGRGTVLQQVRAQPTPEMMNRGKTIQVLERNGTFVFKNRGVRCAMIVFDADTVERRVLGDFKLFEDEFRGTPMVAMYMANSPGPVWVQPESNQYRPKRSGHKWWICKYVNGKAGDIVDEWTPPRKKRSTVITPRKNSWADTINEWANEQEKKTR